MSNQALRISVEQEHYRTKFTQELIDLVGCDPKKLPTTTSKDIALEYLGLTNKKTLDVWRCNGRHGIVMVRVGKYSRPSTEWMINLKLSSMSIAGVAA